VDLHIDLFLQMQEIFILLEAIYNTDALGAAKPDEMKQLAERVKKFLKDADTCTQKALEMRQRVSGIWNLAGTVYARNKDDVSIKQINDWAKDALQYVDTLSDSISIWSRLLVIRWDVIRSVQVEIPGGSKVYYPIRGTPKLRQPILDQLSQNKTDIEIGLQNLRIAARRPSAVAVT
jgi:hypothetical protein